MIKRSKLIENFLKIAKQADISSQIMAIGGAEDKTSRSEILKEFFNLAGGKDCDITIIP
jgi:cyanophycinase-like exopeptidase